MREKITFKSVAGAACVGLVMGSLAWSLTVWGQQGPTPSLEDPTTLPAYPQLGQAKIGVITKVQGRTVWIGSSSYQLAYGVMMQDENGAPVRDRDIAGNKVEYNVQYWLGMGKDSDKIVRMIVFFPR
jgi:hypothetical protein